MKKYKENNSNIELFRILAMLFIVMHHYVVQGQFNLINQKLNFDKIYLQIFSLGGRLGVNCFVLISGYFMINLKFKLKKLFKIISQVWTYSILFLLLFIFYLKPVQSLDFKLVLKSIFPIIYSQWWFITTWIIMYMLSPYINIMAENIRKAAYKKLIGILLLIWCVIPTFSTGLLAYSDIGWFITLYLIGGYIRKYKCFENGCKRHFIFAGVWYGVVILSVLILNKSDAKIVLLFQEVRYFSRKNMLPLFMASLELFLGFKNLKIKNSKMINLIGGATFGVYLFHENIFMKPYLWEVILKNKEYYNTNLLILHSIGSVIIVYTVASIIEIIRQKTLGKLADKLYLKIEESFKNRRKGMLKEYFIKTKRLQR